MRIYHRIANINKKINAETQAGLSSSNFYRKNKKKEPKGSKKISKNKKDCLRIIKS